MSDSTDEEENKMKDEGLPYVPYTKKMKKGDKMPDNEKSFKKMDCIEYAERMKRGYGYYVYANWLKQEDERED